MNKILKTTIVLTIPFLFSSCSKIGSMINNIGYSEVKYDEFHEKAVNAWVDVPYTLATVNGTIVSTKDNTKTTTELKNVRVEVEDGRPVAKSSASTQEQMASTYVYQNATTISDVSNIDSDYMQVSMKYYVYFNGGFKIVEKYKIDYPEIGLKEEGESTIIYDKYGMMTKMAASGTSSGKISISYK